MKKHHRGGFTIIEVMIVVGLLSVLFVLAIAPLLGSLVQTRHETSMLTMDLSAKRSLSRISSALSQALVPIATYPDRDVPVAENSIATFQDLINSEYGFGAHGGEWKQLLMRGADFVPFAVPVDFGADGDTLDSRLALELGILFPDGEQLAAGSYVEADGKNVLYKGIGSLHPSLAYLTPADFGRDTAAGDRSDTDLSQPRFAEQPAFAALGEGFGVVRFVPARKYARDGEEWVTVDENELTEIGNGGVWDLNDDGLAVDVYAVGHLELVYIGRDGRTVAIPVSGSNILLQLNRDSPTWKPLFKLVRQGAQDAPTQGDGEEAGAPDVGGYALLINLLVFDHSAQSGAPLAFNHKLPYLVRRHQTMIELRNMSSANLLKDDVRVALPN